MEQECEACNGLGEVCPECHMPDGECSCEGLDLPDMEECDICLGQCYVDDDDEDDEDEDDEEEVCPDCEGDLAEDGSCAYCDDIEDK